MLHGFKNYFVNNKSSLHPNLHKWVLIKSELPFLLPLSYFVTIFVSFVFNNHIFKHEVSLRVAQRYTKALTTSLVIKIIISIYKEGDYCQPLLKILKYEM